MGIGKKNLNALLDHAITRINQYDDKGSYKKGDCEGCSLSSRAIGTNDDYHDDCEVCPFSVVSLLDGYSTAGDGCDCDAREDVHDFGDDYLYGEDCEYCMSGNCDGDCKEGKKFLRKAEKKWKALLIRSLKKWCKKFHPEYKIEFK